MVSNVSLDFFRKLRMKPTESPSAPSSAAQAETPARTDGPAAATALPGAPFPKDELDPDLIKIRRPPLRIGLLSSGAIIMVSLFLVFRMNADRQFANGSGARTVTPAEIASGKIANNTLVRVAAAPVASHTIRVTPSVDTPGQRAVPVQGSDEHVWLIYPGEALSPVAETFDQAQLPVQQGRLRKLADMRFAGPMRAYATQHPRPVFAAPNAIRAALATGTLTDMFGAPRAITDNDRVVAELKDPEAATVVAVFYDKLPDVTHWTQALVAAGVIGPGVAPIATSDDSASYPVREPNAVAAAIAKLEAAKLYTVRVEPLVKMVATTVGGLKKSSPDHLLFGDEAIADAKLDVIGVYAQREIPAEAWVVLLGETREMYWHVKPLTYALLGLAALFAWAFVRTLRRDVLPRRATRKPRVA